MSYQIAICDDEPAVRERLEAWLIGHDVQTFATAAELFEGLLSEKFDVLLLDLHLPRLKGLETVHRTMANIPGTTPRVIVITGDDTDTLAAECIKLGADDFIPKGSEHLFTREAVRHIVHNCVARAEVDPVRRLLDNVLMAQLRTVELGQAERGQILTALSAVGDVGGPDMATEEVTIAGAAVLVPERETGRERVIKLLLEPRTLLIMIGGLVVVILGLAGRLTFGELNLAGLVGAG